MLEMRAGVRSRDAGRSEETEASRERHARYFLVPDDVPTSFTPVYAAPESSALLAAERDNVRLALMWLENETKWTHLSRATLLFYRLWFAPGLHREGQQWIERALERTSDAAPRMRFQALDAAMTLAVHGGDYARAATFGAERLALARELGDPVLTGEQLISTGHLAYRQGEYDGAEELLLEAHRLLREHADQDTDSVTLLILGDTSLAQEQFDRAAEWYAEAIEKSQSTGYPWILIDAQAGLGGVKACTGNVVQAAHSMARVLAERKTRVSPCS